MTNWFSKRHRKQTESIIEELVSKIHALEQTIERLSEKKWNVHVENVYVHDPVLENLMFRLESLDVQELSGSLNMGNNFGVKLDQEITGMMKQKTGAAQHTNKNRETVDQHKQPKEGKATIDGSPERMRKTSTGYSYKY